MLGVQDIMHRHQVIVFSQDSRSDTAQFLHVTTGSHQETKVDTEGTNVGSRFTFDPKDTEISLGIKFQKFGIVNGSYAQLSLDSRNEGRSLKERSRQCFDSSMKLAGFFDSGMKAHYTDVLLTCRLLCLDQPRGAVNAHNKTASHLWIQCSRVTRLFDAQDSLDPRNNFVRRRIGGFVEVNDSVTQMLIERSGQRRRTRRKWCVVGGTHMKFMVVLEQKRPLGSVELRGC
mmetsp:Transcript_10808/g.17906  ORF Transcript_10808/g.17906 Transcript_10808/m.17906 type:complete len:230 (-) Transcript_10808:152-841(-)